VERAVTEPALCHRRSTATVRVHPINHDRHSVRAIFVCECTHLTISKQYLSVFVAPVAVARDS